MVAMNNNPMEMMKNRYYWIAFLIVILDHVTKWIARAELYPDQMVDIIPGYLRLSCVYNSGVAFGFFDEIQSVWKPYILAALAIIAMVVIFLYGMRMPAERKLLQLALAITMGGILGNFIDRIFRGYVIDFIEFHIHESFRWPTFNMADSAITIGIAFLLIDAVMNPGLEEAASPPAMSDRT
jgi:signal peptidase II